MVNGKDSQALSEAAKSVLDSFILRARRVEEHSLVTDRPQLLSWAQGKLKLTIRVNGGPSELAIDLPDEEALESLAARCRPFILNQETVYHAKVMKALGYLLQQNQELMDSLKGLKTGWKRLDPSALMSSCLARQVLPERGK